MLSVPRGRAVNPQRKDMYRTKDSSSYDDDSDEACPIHAMNNTSSRPSFSFKYEPNEGIGSSSEEEEDDDRNTTDDESDGAHHSKAGTSWSTPYMNPGQLAKQPNHGPGRSDPSEIDRLKQENSRLQLTLQRTRQELSTFQSADKQGISLPSLQATIEQAATATSSSAKDAKLLEMARKIKTLHLTLERERMQARQVSEHLKQSQAECERLRTQDGGTIKEERLSSRLTGEIKTLKERLVEADQKLQDERLQSQSLRVEIRNMEKVLIQELGEDVSIPSILAAANTGNGGNGGWRGRAQTILILKDKIRQLTAGVTSTPVTGCNTPAPAYFPSASSSSTTTTTISLPKLNSSVSLTGTPTTDYFDSRNRSTIQSIEKAKRHANDALRKELTHLKTEHSTLQQRLEAQTSRCKVLEVEMRKAKTKISVLTEKSKGDDKYVAALSAEVEKLELQVKIGKMNLVASGGVRVEEVDQQSSQVPSIAQIERQEGNSAVGHLNASYLENLHLKELVSTLSNTIVDQEAKLSLATSSSKSASKLNPPGDKKSISGRKSADSPVKRPPLPPGTLSSVSIASNPATVQKKDLEGRLELAQDEIAVLKATLQSSLKVKDMELASYAKIIQELKTAAAQ